LFHIYFQNKRVIIFCSIFYPKDNTGDVKSKSAKCQSIQALGFPLNRMQKIFFIEMFQPEAKIKQAMRLNF